MVLKWRVITWAPNYAVSNTGLIYKFKGYKSNGGKIMKQRPDKDGYMRLSLHNEGKEIYVRVHRVVAEFFIPNDDPNKDQVNHIDGNVKNNHVENLEWCSIQENLYHEHHILPKLRGVKRVYKTDNTSIKCEAYKGDEKVGEFSSLREASKYCSEHYGVSESSLYRHFHSGDIRLVRTDK